MDDNEIQSVGTWFIRAPEVDIDPKYKADKADIFSLGIIFGEIISNKDGENFRLAISYEKEDFTFGVDVNKIPEYFEPYTYPISKLLIIF